MAGFRKHHCAIYAARLLQRLYSGDRRLGHTSPFRQRVDTQYWNI